ncbi:hypothetical protein BC629DRAFT_232508 [Irpex lacteus]|nr:hypothetical protein BC629DRAFT_232508 [Irpex lacteus]
MCVGTSVKHSPPEWTVERQAELSAVRPQAPTARENATFQRELFFFPCPWTCDPTHLRQNWSAVWTGTVANLPSMSNISQPTFEPPPLPPSVITAYCRSGQRSSSLPSWIASLACSEASEGRFCRPPRQWRAGSRHGREHHHRQIRDAQRQSSSNFLLLAQ